MDLQRQLKQCIKINNKPICVHKTINLLCYIVWKDKKEFMITQKLYTDTKVVLKEI